MSKKNETKIFTPDVLYYYRDTPEPQGLRCKLFKPGSTSTVVKLVINEMKSTASGVSEISDIAK